jgi:hypothetical protein
MSVPDQFLVHLLSGNRLDSDMNGKVNKVGSFMEGGRKSEENQVMSPPESPDESQTPTLNHQSKGHFAIDESLSKDKQQINNQKRPYRRRKDSE